MFLGFINLASPSWLIIILAAAAQFFQARLAIWRAPAGSQPSQAEKIQRQMMYVTPRNIVPTLEGAWIKE